MGLQLGCDRQGIVERVTADVAMGVMYTSWSRKGEDFDACRGEDGNGDIHFAGDYRPGAGLSSTQGNIRNVGVSAYILPRPRQLADIPESKTPAGYSRKLGPTIVCLKKQKI